jgi:hypothetical protein
MTTALEMFRLETDRADSLHVMLDLGMIELRVGKENEPAKFIVTKKGERALEAACDRERAQ